MNKAQKLTLIIAVAVIVVIAGGALIYVNFFFERNTTDNTNVADTNNVSSVNDNTNQDNTGSLNTNDGLIDLNVNVSNTNIEVPAEPVVQSDESSLLRLAKIFVERYGSYSNKNDFENIKNLQSLMTDKFQKESEAYIKLNESDDEAAQYYGITTTAASMKIVALEEGSSGTVEVATRRVESRQGEDPTTYTQYIDVFFKNVDGTWKVHNVKWK